MLCEEVQRTVPSILGWIEMSKTGGKNRLLGVLSSCNIFLTQLTNWDRTCSRGSNEGYSVAHHLRPTSDASDRLEQSKGWVLTLHMLCTGLGSRVRSDINTPQQADAWSKQSIRHEPSVVTQKVLQHWLGPNLGRQPHEHHLGFSQMCGG